MAATGVLAALSGTAVIGAAPVAAADVQIKGAGSTFLGPAMAKWVAASGVNATYTANGSVTGLGQYGAGTVDVGATELAFPSLAPADQHVADARGFQYVPVAGGGVGIMFHVQDASGNDVTDLTLSPRTLARIFLGEISNWSDPAITRDNGGRALGNHSITLYYPAGQSTTTAVLYEYIRHTAPDLYPFWAQAFGFPTDRPLAKLDANPAFAPITFALTSGDQMAAGIASSDGLWSIGYDEYAYALAHNTHVARVVNRTGHAVLPTAAAVTQALLSASVNANGTPNLDGVYDTLRPSAYPISSYSYVVTPCMASSSAPTCKGGYANADVATGVATFLRYIACAGQVVLPDTGYARLPANLSQEVANAIGRIKGTVPETLTAANCANPAIATPVTPEAPGTPVTPDPPVPPPPPSRPATVYRLRADGADRIDTALQLSAFSYLKDHNAGAVVLARSDDSVDALAGTPLAVAKNAPLLVNPPAFLDGRVANEIVRVLPAGGTVYLLGGPSALSPAVEGAIRAGGYTVVRLAGGDRYATSVAIADAVGATNQILLTTGNNVADALSAGAAAGAVHGTLVLTDDGIVPPVVSDYLNRHAGTLRLAVGGPAASGLPGVAAIVGGDRYQTSALVASAFFANAMVATFANGTTPDPSRPTAAGVDALAGGAVAAKIGAPVLLVETSSLPAPVAGYLAASISRLALLIIYGGRTAVAQSVADAINATLGLGPAPGF